MGVRNEIFLLETNGFCAFLPSRARPIPKLTAVTVLPTPPFWLQIAVILAVFLMNRRVYYINNVTKKLSAFTDSWLKAAKSISPVNTAK